MGAETLRFTTGECDVSGSFFALHLGTLVPSAPTSPRPYFGSLVKAPRGGVFKGAGALVAFSFEGVRHALTGATKVTLTGNQHRGTFSGRLANGMRVGGSFAVPTAGSARRHRSVADGERRVR